jgi:hypothetical protein
MPHVRDAADTRLSDKAGGSVNMRFGRYKGRPLDELPADYLDWLTSIELREPLKTHVQREVRRRRALGADAHMPPELRATAIEIVSRGYRALSRERHPDAGGTHDGMVEVTAAREALDRMIGGRSA